MVSRKRSTHTARKQGKPPKPRTKPVTAQGTKPNRRYTATNVPGSEAAKRTIAPNSKLGTLLALLRREEGSTVAEMVKATGWQPHSIRGALSGTVRKKLGLELQSSKIDRVRIYRIAE
ncbi:MAG: DUF3489 domain-containing protein [Alphaproteobacteria bacterium]|nr:DUF3489 domain-containing protein [Alphaproteobacteria bacterium]